MIKVIGVRFRQAGKIYYFSPGKLKINRGDHVIVETARGVEYGYVVVGNRDVEDDRVVQPLKPVIRMATEQDDQQAAANKEKEKEAFKICKEKIQKHNLEMKLVEAEYTFDNNKLLFYFTADGRIDFRELVKDLAAVFRTRIELRQIGVRDETKIMGGIGICGRELCCKSYLTDFVPVSIKMAKEQNLSLNPTKISGVCGRLMCCLKNEQETYEYLNSRLPVVGDTVQTDDGFQGEVNSVSVLRQLVKVLIDNGDEKELREYHVEQLSFRPRRRKDVKLTAEEMKELKALEDDQNEVEEKDNNGGSRGNRPNNHRNQDRPQRENRRDYKRADRRDENRSQSENRSQNDNHAQNDNRVHNDNRSQSENRSQGDNRSQSDNRRESHYQNRNRKKNNRRDFEGREKRREQSKNHDAE